MCQLRREASVESDPHGRDESWNVHRERVEGRGNVEIGSESGRGLDAVVLVQTEIADAAATGVRVVAVLVAVTGDRRRTVRGA